MCRGGNSSCVDAAIAPILCGETLDGLEEETGALISPDDWESDGDEALNLESREEEATASTRRGSEGIVDLEVVGLLVDTLPSRDCCPGEVEWRFRPDNPTEWDLSGLLPRFLIPGGG